MREKNAKAAGGMHKNYRHVTLEWYNHPQRDGSRRAQMGGCFDPEAPDRSWWPLGLWLLQTPSKSYRNNERHDDYGTIVQSFSRGFLQGINRTTLKQEGRGKLVQKYRRWGRGAKITPSNAAQKSPRKAFPNAQKVQVLAHLVEKSWQKWARALKMRRSRT